MYETIDFTLVGEAPTILHSGRMANPLDPMSKLFGKTKNKRSKSDEDLALLSEIEWLAAFYPSEPGECKIIDNKLVFSGFGVPNWPGDNIESMLIEAAKKQKRGKQFKAGCLCDGQFPIDFGEKKTIQQIFGDPRYIDVRPVKIQQNRVMRTRPIFHEWRLKVKVSYLPELIDSEHVRDAMQTAGVHVGLSDNRPKYGRFRVV